MLALFNTSTSISMLSAFQGCVCRERMLCSLGWTWKPCCFLTVTIQIYPCLSCVKWYKGRGHRKHTTPATLCTNDPYLVSPSPCAQSALVGLDFAPSGPFFFLNPYIFLFFVLTCIYITLASFFLCPGYVIVILESWAFSASLTPFQAECFILIAPKFFGD